jgi:hypothetical protein
LDRRLMLLLLALALLPVTPFAALSFIAKK